MRNPRGPTQKRVTIAKVWIIMWRIVPFRRLSWGKAKRRKHVHIHPVTIPVTIPVAIPIRISSPPRLSLDIPDKVESPQSASTIMKGNHVPKNVIDSTCVQDAVVQNLDSDVPGVPQIRARSLLKRAAWASVMARHPNQKYAIRLMSYIDNGVPILY